MASSGAISAVYVADLERRLAESEAARVAETSARAEAETRLAEVEEARDRLERMVMQARREKFGAKSEKLNPDQRFLPFEDIDVAEGMLDAASEAAEKALGNRKKGRRPSNRNKGNLPDHLDRIEQVIEPESTLWSPLGAPLMKWMAPASGIVMCHVGCC